MWLGQGRKGCSARCARSGVVGSVAADGRALRPGRSVARVLRHRHPRARAAHRRAVRADPRRERAAPRGRHRASASGSECWRASGASPRSRGSLTRAGTTTAAGRSSSRCSSASSSSPASARATAPTSRLLAIPPLLWIGIRSYGIYLWHWPIIVYVNESRTGLDGVSLDARAHPPDLRDRRALVRARRAADPRAAVRVPRRAGSRCRSRSRPSAASCCSAPRAPPPRRRSCRPVPARSPRSRPRRPSSTVPGAPNRTVQLVGDSVAGTLSAELTNALAKRYDPDGQRRSSRAAACSTASCCSRTRSRGRGPARATTSSRSSRTTRSRRRDPARRALAEHLGGPGPDHRRQGGAARHARRATRSCARRWTAPSPGMTATGAHVLLLTTAVAGPGRRAARRRIVRRAAPVPGTEPACTAPTPRTTPTR